MSVSLIAPHTPLALRVLLTRYASTAALHDGVVRSDLLRFDYHQSKTVFENFPSLINDLSFDLSELALASYLQAKQEGADLVLLPVVMNARLPHDCLVCHKDRPITLSALRGKRIAVRSYAQTTVTWLRGILHERYAIAPEDNIWLTAGPGHVSTITDPPWTQPAPAQAKAGALLAQGLADCAILSPKFQDLSWMQPVITDAAADAASWQAQTGVTPINHVVVLKGPLARARPDILAEVWRMLQASHAAAPQATRQTLPLGTEALWPVIARFIGHAHRDGVLRAPLTRAEVFCDQIEKLAP